MPRYDGTGPASKGPMTGRGEGFCAVKEAEAGEISGLAGFQNRPFRSGWVGFLTRAFGPGRRGGGRGRGRGAGRRRW
jgi:hypothetical protein